ncbi:MAG: hypothetical protein KY468_12025 [Armatimonadetes bacterium]|nr:hypothetical protein [Armatimonadota bacterium]
MTRKPILVLSCFILSLISALPALAGGIMVVGGQTRQTQLKASEKNEGRILLKNTSDRPGEVRIFSTDYRFTAEGSNDFGTPAGKMPRSNAAWITYTPKQLSLAPGETAWVDYTVQVPQDEQLAGTYWSVLMVEPLASAALEPPKSKEGQVSVGLQTVIRYAIQMVTHIGDTGKREIRYISPKLVADGEKRVLQVDLENTGERWLSPQVWVELFDDKGTSLGRFDGGRQRIFPGCSTRSLMDLSQVPQGKYTGLIVADNGDEYVFGTQSAFEIP